MGSVFSMREFFGLKTIGHIFVSERSDFYEITDDEPQFERSSAGKLDGDYK